jgi:hypothetical protein
LHPLTRSAKEKEGQEMNDTKEKTCADRIAEQLASEERNLSDIYAVLDGEIKPTEDQSETQTIDEAYSDLYNYALGINTIKETTITLSWGGPASYLEVLHDGAEITRLTYRFSDWFDTATEEITDKESNLYRYAQEMINIQEGAF